MVDMRFELTTSSSSPFDDAICQGSYCLARWATGKKVNPPPTTQTEPYHSNSSYLSALNSYPKTGLYR